MWIRVTVALVVISILMGLNYLLLEAPAYPERSIHFFYGVSAGSVFQVAQVAGLVDLWKRRPEFIRWIVPPALYLLAIGLIGFFRFGNALPLAADSGRGVLLLAFSFAASAELRKSRGLPVVTVLIGLLLVPGTGAAQQAERQLYLTYDPDRATCLLPEEGSSRCFVMECGPAGDHCTCPLKLPNDWKQPLTEDQCRQLNAMLRPLPPEGAERLGPDGGVVPPIPGDCTAEQHRALQDAVDATCKVPRKCNETQDCATLRRNHDQNLACIRAREKINTTCFRGGDLTHRTPIDQAHRTAATCAKLIGEKKCR